MLIHNILSPSEINDIVNHPVVQTHKAQLSDTDVVKFSLPLAPDIKDKLSTRLGISLSSRTTIPMRWIKGDTLPHIDRGESQFTKTHLVYLTSSSGSLVIDGQAYPIHAGDAHIFSEGLEHFTINTGTTERLLLGPMSETGFGVGAAVYIKYFESRADAENNNNATSLDSSPPTDMTGYTHDDTTIYRMTITGNSSIGSVWGTNLYTSDSTIVRAAVHAGVIANGETKEVYIKMEGPQSEYFGSTRNGVRTVSYTNSSLFYLSYYFMDTPQLWVGSGTYTVQPVNDISAWIIYTNEYGTSPSPDGGPYNSGTELVNTGTYFLYPYIPPPPPQPQPPPFLFCGSMFSNNAQVHYKSHSLSTGSGGSGVRNSRYKKRRT
jgi:hypothetical protein